MDVRAPKSTPFKRPSARDTKKRPAAKAKAKVAAPSVEAAEAPKPTNRNLEADLNKEAGKEDPVPSDPKKGQPAKNANVVEEIEYPLGWMAYKYRTQKGREYWKYVGPDGDYYFSQKVAKQHGFAPEAESCS